MWQLLHLLVSYLQLRSAINAASDVTILMDTATSNTDYSNTMYHADVSGSYRWLFGEAEATYQDTFTKLQSSRIVVEAHFEKGSSDIAGTVMPGSWYDSSLVSQAKSKGPAAFFHLEDYNEFFGPKGTLNYRTGNLYFVAGKFQVKITIHTSISEDERTYLQTKVSGGIWPFFKIGASTEQSTVKISTFDGTTVIEYGSDYLVAPVAIAMRANIN